MNRDHWSYLGVGGESAAWLKTYRPEVLKRWQQAVDGDHKFIYYTNADTALKIIRNEEIWMRSPSVMNDFMEVEYARECLLKALSPQALGWLQYTLGAHKWSTDYREFFQYLSIAGRNDGSKSYVFCLSEYDEEQDALGRLSMWRAYGGGNGVALIFNGRKFLQASLPHEVAIIPVDYATPEQLAKHFSTIWPTIRDKFVPPETKQIDKEWASWNIYPYVYHCLLTIKHPGFREEREWRMVITSSSACFETDIVTISGVPQAVLKFPLGTYDEDGSSMGPFADLLAGVIVGPSAFPEQIADAFKIELANKKIDPSIIKISGIPLRV